MYPLKAYFTLFAVFGRAENPDSDGIIGSAQETKPTLFKRLFGSNSRLHPCNIIMIRFGKSQQSHKVVLCWCNVGVRQPGIQRGRNEATQQLTDFLWPGQTKFTTQQMLIVLVSLGFCLTDDLYSRSFLVVA